MTKIGDVERFVTANLSQRIYKDELTLILRLPNDEPRKMAKILFRPATADLYIALPYLNAVSYSCGRMSSVAGQAKKFNTSGGKARTSRLPVKLSYHESGEAHIKAQNPDAPNASRLARLQLKPLAELTGEHVFTLELEGIAAFARAKPREVDKPSSIAIALPEEAYRAKLTGYFGDTPQSVSSKYKSESGVALFPTATIRFIRPTLPRSLFLGLYLFTGDSLQGEQRAPTEIAMLGFRVVGKLAQSLFVHATTENAPPSPTEAVGRNDRCPCGSGKKYKKCCLA